MKISFVEFNKRVREEWAGRKYYYDSEFQYGQTDSAMTMRVRFDSVYTMLNPNCITFRNAAGDSMLLSGVIAIEAEPLTESSVSLRLITQRKGANAVSVIVR